MTETIVEGIFTVLGSAVGGGAISIVLNRYYVQKDKRKLHNVAKQAVSDNRLERLLTEIKDLTGAPRVSVWAYSNGGYFYTGHAMQHLNMIAEAPLDEGIEPIKDKSQKLPIHLFSRNLAKLFTSDTGFYQEYNELQYNDALSKMNAENGMVSQSLFRILNKEGKDIACLTIGFPQHRLLDQAELELVKGFLPTIKFEIEQQN